MTATRDQQQKRPSQPQEEDLGGLSPPQRNWKGIAIALLVILVVCSLITMSVIVLTPPDNSGGSSSKLTVDDLFKSEFIANEPEAKWISDSEVLFKNQDGHVVKYNVASNETEILLKNSTFSAFKVAKYSVSPDKRYVLFAYDVKQVYKYSYTASYIIYNIYTREVWELNPPEVHDSVLQFADWGIKGQQLIYIFENNIYYRSDVRSNALRLTSSGKEGVIFNGIADWLYEEEVLKTHIAHWWSPDGEVLAFLVLDDTEVPNMALPQFTGAAYPRGKIYPYPKAGQSNPVVQLFVVNLYGPAHTQELRLDENLKRELRDYYVVMVKWISNTHTAVRWLNRAQNISILTVCDATTGACLKEYEETSELWLSKQEQEPVFTRDISKFFLTVPVKQGGQGEFHHIAMVTKPVRGESSQVQLTSGDWEVTKILAYDETDQILYFLSTEGSPRRRHLHSVSTLGLSPPRCLTCGLVDERGSFYDAIISPDTQHAILKCQGPGAPSVILLSLANPNNYVVLEDNIQLRDALQQKKVQKTDYCIVVSDNSEVHLEILYPVDFSESNDYGLLLVVDATPGGQAVNDKFSLDWASVLVSSHEVVVVRADGRGSGFRGQKVLQQVQPQLGHLEVQDQLAALKYMMSFRYIDKKRIGIYGKGYGGYTILKMLKEKPITCAVAHSPVVDWRNYASFTAERYLGMPANNENRYQLSSVMPISKDLLDMKLMIIHGTSDAKVHFQHSAELIKHLIQIGANYSMQIYPDEGHDLSVKSQRHLSDSLTGFFLGCLRPPLPPPSDEVDDEEDEG